MEAPRPGRAALWMLGSIAAFIAMAIGGRAAGGQHDTFEIMLWRSVVGLALVLGVAGEVSPFFLRMTDTLSAMAHPLRRKPEVQ